MQLSQATKGIVCLRPGTAETSENMDSPLTHRAVEQSLKKKVVWGHEFGGGTQETDNGDGELGWFLKGNSCKKKSKP
jgi:hypothetical protein